MAYEALELGQPGNPACPDAFNEASTLLCAGATRLVLQTSVAAVFVELGVMPHGKSGLGSVQWLGAKPFLPIVASLGRTFDAVRVRNYTKGVAAQVLLSVEGP
jgi:hypothetical protein